MAEVNLLRHCPKTKRKLARPRSQNKANVQAAAKFEREYFDGRREEGYGGYKYDGRWVPVARDIINHFNLKPGNKILDIGCAKGFLVNDLMSVCPGLEVFGLDISRYATAHAEPEARNRIVVGTADNLPFADESFDAVISINTLHNLEGDRLKFALREIERLAPGCGYVQVDAYRTKAEREVFLGWVLTAVTFLMPNEWTDLFAEVGYTGDYNWTILDADSNWTDFNHTNRPTANKEVG